MFKISFTVLMISKMQRNKKFTDIVLIVEWRDGEKEIRNPILDPKNEMLNNW